jgi:acetyltransferase-like isoleucine patch superfamily enzyme
MNKLLLLKIKRQIYRRIKGDEYVAKNLTIKIANKMGIKIGENCRLFSKNFSTEPFLIEVGNHVTITDNVQFITHDGGVWVFREKYPDIDLFGRIIIGNNVFIGLGSIILLNTKIGDNSIIAAGSIVKGTFEPNSIIAGVPAKKISTIDQYFEKNKDNFTYLRNMPQQDKILKILQHFQNIK